MKFIQPEAEELELLRADPLLVEQELDVRPAVARSLERALGARAGRFYWRSDSDHLYAIELWDAGRGWPSSATVFGFWERFEPRPPEVEIDRDLVSALGWLAEQADGIERSDFERVVQFEKIPLDWPEGSVLRTPDERFQNLPGFGYELQYVEIEGLRMAYVEAGAGNPILMLHGEPTWGYLYRHMIPPLEASGRVIVPDLIGFGRSDKPVEKAAYTYRSQARRVRKFIEALNLQEITLVCQDWGGLLGLRVLSEIPDRFTRVVVMNTGLPCGEPQTATFLDWRRFSQSQPYLEAGQLLGRLVTRRKLSQQESAAYDAPFPGPEYQAGALAFPTLVPIRADQLASYENRNAAARLSKLKIPTFMIWGEQDGVSAVWEPQLRKLLRPSEATIMIKDAGHFIQEDAGSEVAEHIASWLARS
jgi:haloalkane dehalogenase